MNNSFGTLFGFIIFVASAPFLSLSEVYAQGTVFTFVFEEGRFGYSGFEDATLYEGTTDQSHSGGGIDGIFSGTIARRPDSRRALIRIDLSSIAPGAQVASVELELTVDESGGNFGEFDYTLHRVLRDWGEGSTTAIDRGGTGAPAAPGDATWLSNFHEMSTWDSPGGDFATEISATAPAGRKGDKAVWSGPGLATDVQNWIDNPSSNFGWLILSTIEGTLARVKRFHSSEAATSRPRLTVTFAPADPDIDGNGAVDAVDLQLVVNAALGIDISPFDADVSADGQVNSSDVVFVIQSAFQK